LLSENKAASAGLRRVAAGSDSVLELDTNGENVMLGSASGNDSVEAVEAIVGHDLTFLGKIEFYADGFVLEPDDAAFHWLDPLLELPPETDYFAVKSADAFEVFALTENPFDLSTYTGSHAVSHVSAYDAATVPEPSSGFIFGALMVLVFLFRPLLQKGM
jgi:hypothetical protein